MSTNLRPNSIEEEGVPVAEDRKPRGSLATGICNLDKLCRSHRRKRRGAAVVEFAVVAPIFFLLVFGMIEYGRMVMVQQVLTNASREGARRGVLDGAMASEITATVNEDLRNRAITGASVTIKPVVLADAAAGDPVTVSVSIPFSQVSWLPTPMFLGETDMTASTVMRRESVQ